MSSDVCASLSSSLLISLHSSLLTACLLQVRGGGGMEVESDHLVIPFKKFIFAFFFELFLVFLIVIKALI